MKELVPIAANQLELSEYAQFFRFYEKTPYTAYPLALNLRISDYLAQLDQRDGKSQYHLQLNIAYYHHRKFIQSLDAIQRNINFVHYVFDQAVYDIQIGRYLKPKEEYVAMIALILQYRLQDSGGDQRILQYVLICQLLNIIFIVTKSGLFFRPNLQNPIKPS